MKIRGIFEGSYESVWSMEVNDYDWNTYLEQNPDFDENDREHMQDMWEHFKNLGCYDEIDDTKDFDTHITGLELN